ncbi:MAG: M16 family metallopeptidase [Caldimicrobium sp.]
MTKDLSAENLIIDRVQEKILPSKLKVLLVPKEGEKIVAVYLCVKVGSKYEWEEVAGITHLIEHMIFKGGEGQATGEVAGKIEEQGGYINAFTSYDLTCYYVVGPENILETALEVLSQAVFRPYFDPQELEKEKEVVVEEMKMRLDNPMIVLFEELMKASYHRYPYKRPIIGYEASVRSLKREDLFYFVNHFYLPENMILVISGDLNFAKVDPLLEKYFFSLPQRQLKKVSFPKEPYTSKATLKWIERAVRESYFAFSFPASSINSDDAPLLDLLAELLGGGESSLFSLKLKREKELVKSISTSAFTPDGPGLFEIYGKADPKNFKTLLEETLRLIREVKESGPTLEDLERAKNRVLSTFIYSQETAEGLARQMATFQLLRNSYKDILWYKEKIEKATPKDIQEVAKKWLREDKLVVVFLSDKALFGEEVLKELLKERSPKKSAEILELENGLKVILYPRKEVPTVGITLAFPGGVRVEEEGTNGLFQALTLLWTRGTKNYKAEELSQKIEGLGASIQGFTGRNTFGLKALTLSPHLFTILDLFIEILLNPTFKDEEIEKARPELLSLLYQQEDQPFSLALKEFLKAFYPNHPYGLNLAGSKNFYLTFNSELLKGAYNKFVDPKRGKLVIVGDFDSEEVKKYLKAHLSQWKGSKMPINDEPEPTPAQISSKVVPKDSFQTQILLGFRAPGLLSEKRTLLEVLNSALSGQDGPLFKILRDERSLAYAVTSFLLFYPKSSALIFYLACAPEKKAEAISGFFEVIEKLKKDKFSERDLERAKNRLLGKYRMSLQSNLAKAEDMAVNEVLGLGWDFSAKYQDQIQNISTNDLIQTLEEFIHEKNSFLLILGKEK